VNGATTLPLHRGHRGLGRIVVRVAGAVELSAVLHHAVRRAQHRRVHLCTLRIAGAKVSHMLSALRAGDLSPFGVDLAHAG
jgi:hypothetical protein